MKLKLKLVPANCRQNQNLVAVSRVPFSATQKSSVISTEQDGKEEEGEEEDEEGDFSLADKYSNQMSLPLWDPGAQIQAIPGSSLIQKRLCVGCVRVCLNKKKLERAK